MHGSNAAGEDRTSRLAAMADAVVAAFGARAQAVVERQINAAEGDARASWEAILVHVQIVASERG